MKLAIVIEQGSDGSYSAYAPDVPAVGVGGRSEAEVKQKLAEAIEFYLEDADLPVAPTATVDYIDAAIAS